MIKRIEFTLNLADPRDEAIYRALVPSLRYRRAGALIRQALGVFLSSNARPPVQPHSPQERKLHEQS
ncbi:MAG: hypothetical protein IT323_12635 [Anaerolineae bacterium]|nr:hypothetical protein [Anaerolineae bacterium]